MTCSTTESSTRSSGFRLPWLFLAIVLGVAIMLGLCLGSVRIPASSIWVLLSGGEISESWRTIILDLRLPRVVTAVLAGAALASSGLIMQTLFGNGLAGPSVLGVSSGASLGAALALLAAPGSGMIARLGLLGCSFTGALLTMILVAVIGERVRVGGTLLILGLMIGYTVNAIVSVLIQWAPSERVHGFVSWSFGTFTGVGWDRIPWMAAAVVVGLTLALKGCRFWDTFLLGETCAATVGADVPMIRRRMILISALLAGTVTAFCGPIAFLGVAVPHMARGISGSARHGRLLPVTLLCGASLAVAADLLSRLPGGASTLPLNSVTSLIGAPVVAWVVFRGGDR